VPTSILLGQLQSVELREAWQSEAGDFTPWLASKDNIALLGKTIGLDLEVESQEQSVGQFRADILCKDTASQTWVLIENQLERTDHTHLGQLITYAAGLEAATIVWVAAEIRDEHRAALDWLNQITGDDFSFFGLEVELWRIGDSPMAPKFNIVCKPNDWSRHIVSAAKSAADGSLSENQQLQLEYWTAFREYMLSAGGVVKPTKAHPQGFMDFSLGKAGIWLETSINVRDQKIAVLIIVGTEQSTAYFKLLELDRKKFDNTFGEPLDWVERPGKKQQLIRIRLEGADPKNRSDWRRQHTWIHDKLQRLHKTFSSAVKSLDAADYTVDEDEANE
jgi:hypothetical protein